MKKGLKVLFLCMAVALPMLFLTFRSQAEDKQVEISVYALPSNGSDEKHLMCGSSLFFTVDINSPGLDKEHAEIDWNVTKKDGTSMQAVYEVRNNGQNLEVYAPYGYSEELEVSVCVNGNQTLTDTYTFETQENEKMVGKTFFQFDLGSEADDIVCSPTTEVWDASKQTYTITMPYVSHKNNCILFHGWKCFDGEIYDSGAKVTVPRKNGFMPVLAWYDVLDKPEVIATKAPIFTDEPTVTTGAAVTTAPAETAQASAIPSVAPKVTTEPAVSVTPEETEVAEATAVPATTLVPEATAIPTITLVPEATAAPEISQTPIVTIAPEETQVLATNTPEMTKEPLVSVSPVQTLVPVVSVIPAGTKVPAETENTETTASKEIKKSVAKQETNKKNTAPKISVKRDGSRKVKVSWSKVSKADEYRIAYSLNRNFKNGTTKYKRTKATKITLAKLKMNKTYYVKVCSYKIFDDKKVYGTYSVVKKVTLK